MQFSFLSVSRNIIATALIATYLFPTAAEAKDAPVLPSPEVIAAIFKQGSEPAPTHAVKSPDNTTPDPLCRLAPADLTESRGAKIRTYKLLIEASDNDPQNPSKAFFRVHRFTVDADGSSRAYHPDDPLGVGVCVPGKSKACALDEFSSAEIRLFRNNTEIDPHASEQEHDDFLATWSGLWAKISHKLITPLDHRSDPRIPNSYALYYFSDTNLTVVFNTAIIPFNNDAPCIRGPKLRDPGYFVAATSFTTRNVTPDNVCDPSLYIDASTVPFVVLPGGPFGKLAVGDIAVGYAQAETGDRLVYGIVGDTGPLQKLAEGSIAFNSKMIRRTKPLANSTEQGQIDINLSDTPASRDHITAMSVLVLGGTMSALKGDYSADHIAKIGNRLLNVWSGKRDPKAQLADCMKIAPENPWQVP